MRKILFLFACFLMASLGLVNAQSKSISGRVLYSEDGEAIIGASVKVKGDPAATVTDVNGHFTIKLNENAKILIVSFVGMKTQEVDATNNMVVKLQSSSSELDEVIVVAYGSTKKSSFTGAASQVKGDQLQKFQVSSLSKSLEGASSGVQTVSNSGTPGSDAS
ncbi:MAG: carboxypeptidase-like regulatory domain-containing protein, partial [Bacteroidales bacterium]|nr:carboxypeptidase-like regulatory domain-containing protein [Bacteroidales bacterium]